eukprot:7956985-Pyramimonas_sp.AAC.1
MRAASTCDERALRRPGCIRWFDVAAVGAGVKSESKTGDGPVVKNWGLLQEYFGHGQGPG